MSLHSSGVRLHRRNTDTDLPVCRSFSRPVLRSPVIRAEALGPRIVSSCGPSTQRWSFTSSPPPATRRRTDRRREGGSARQPRRAAMGGGERGGVGGVNQIFCVLKTKNVYEKIPRAAAASDPPSAKCIPVNIRGVHLLSGSIPPAQPPLAPPASD